MFAYGRHLLMADICLRQVFNYDDKSIMADHYGTVKNAKLKIGQTDYGVKVALGSFPEGEDPCWEE